MLVPTLFAGAGGQRRHPSRRWQVQLELQVSGVTSPSYPGHSLQFWSKTQRFPFGTFQCSKSLDSHSDDSLLLLSGPDDRNHLDAGTSAVCRHSFDRFDDSFQQVTDKCQTGRLSTLHSRGHLDANPGVTIGEILVIFRKKSGCPNDDSS